MEHKEERTEPYAKRSMEEMREVLMHPDSEGPKIHYYMIRGGSDKKNITVWETGTIGGEYIKSYGHYHIKDFKEVYEIIHGEGILLLQERKIGPSGEQINDELELVKAIFVKPGDVIPIPPRSGHLMINIGKTWLVTADDSPVALTQEEKNSWPAHADYSAVREMHGFGYYAVNKEGKIVFEKNERYKNLPELIIEKK